jgi:hypothetical protein
MGRVGGTMPHDRAEEEKRAAFHTPFAALRWPEREIELPPLETGLVSTPGAINHQPSRQQAAAAPLPGRRVRALAHGPRRCGPLAWWPCSAALRHYRSAPCTKTVSVCCQNVRTFPC